jgi:ketosteroid isomerase-like protein
MMISTSALLFIDRIRDYLARLEQADVPGLVALFGARAVVHSPFLGTLAPQPFFEQLAAATRSSTLRSPEVFVSSSGSRRAVACFTYDWALRDGRSVSFHCADIFEFDDEGRIDSLTIVYDTAPIRDQVGDKYRNNP